MNLKIKHHMLGMFIFLSLDNTVYALNDYDANSNRISFAQLVNVGLMNNPKIQVEEAKVKNAITQIKIEKGGYWPSLNLSIGPENGLYGDLGYDISLSQTLYDWGKVSSNIDAATAKKLKQMQSLLIARSDASLEILEVCFDLYKAKEQLNAINKYQSELNAIYDLVKIRVDNEFSDSSEMSKVLKAQAYLDEQFAIIEGERKLAEGLYTILLRLPPSTLPTFTSSQDFFDTLNTPILLENAILHSPEYMKYEQDIYIAKFQAKSATAALRPSLVLEAMTVNREISGELTKDSTIGLNLKMQISNGLSGYYQSQSEMQLVEAAEWALQSVRRDLSREVNSSRETRLALKQRMNALEQQTDQSLQLTVTYKDQFTAGLKSIEDLLSSEADTFRLQNQLINASIEYHQLPYRLAAKLGMLNTLLINNNQRDVY